MSLHNRCENLVVRKFGQIRLQARCGRPTTAPGKWFCKRCAANIARRQRKFEDAQGR